jgi:hypothetical protein
MISLMALYQLSKCKGVKMSGFKTTVIPFKKTLTSLCAAAIMLLPGLPIFGVAISHAATGASYVTLSSFSGHPDADLKVSGGNYAASEQINIVATENGSMVASTTTPSTSTGTFNTTLDLPAKLTQGGVLITASGKTSGLTSNNEYYVDPFSPSLSASSAQTTPYSTLSVSGSGYAPDEQVELNLAGATTQIETDQTGSFTGASITTPDVPAASYTITGVGESSGASAVAYEYVNGFYPSASPTSYYLMPDTSLGFNGSGFAANEKVNVTDATSGALLSSFTTDATGAFKNAGSFTVGTNYAGESVKFVLTGTVSQASTTVTTTVGQYYPNVSPSVYYVMPGGSLGFNGSGFIPGEKVDVSSNKVLIETITADAKGDLTDAGSLTTIPSNEAGTVQSYTLTGETSKGSGNVSVQIGNYNAQASPSSYYVTPGSVITFDGTGYAPNEVVAVFSGLNNVGSIAADSTGAFLNAGNFTVGYNQANSTLSYSLVGAVSKQPISFSIGVGQLQTELTPSSYYVLPYSAFSVSATGFAPNESVSIANGTTNLGTAKANALGTATFTNISLPYNGLSSATLTATGATSNATAKVSIGIGSYNATITSSNYYAKPGDTIMLSGTGFAPNESVSIAAGSLTTIVPADAKGDISSSLVLPFGQTKSGLTITATGSMSHATTSATITLAPFMPEVSPSTYYSQPGTPISFTGTGFAPNETIDVSLNGSQVGTETANSMGNLKSISSYTLPFGTTADFTFNGLTSGASSSVNVGLAQFYSGLQLSSYYGNGGSVLTATGSGFAPNELIRIQSGTSTLAKTAANSTGSFSVPIEIPYSTAGKISITASGSESGSSATTSYTVAQVYNSVTLSSYSAVAGNPVTILGSGFFGGEPVTVTTNRTTGSYTFDASSQGTLDNSGFVIPQTLAAGPLTLTINGTESYTSEQITIYVSN